jgi:hypothetical protein
MVHLEILEPASRKKMIVADHRKGGIMCLRKLMDLGHTKILYINVFLSSLNKSDQMSAIRWIGIRKEAEKRKLSHVKKEDVILGRGTDFLKKQVVEMLKKYRGYTGIITSLGTDHIKDTLEKRPVSETKKMDLIYFIESDSPYLINRKPVWRCKWDGRKMGRLALKTLLDKKDSYPKIQYLPMHLDQNIYTVSYFPKKYIGK